MEKLNKKRVRVINSFNKLNQLIECVKNVDLKTKLLNSLNKLTNANSALYIDFLTDEKIKAIIDTTTNLSVLIDEVLDERLKLNIFKTLNQLTKIQLSIIHSLQNIQKYKENDIAFLENLEEKSENKAERLATEAVLYFMNK